MARIRTNGVEIEVDERGSGEPVLLVMGLGAQLVFWDERFCDSLADRGFRVVRFDNRDCGLSTRLVESGVPDVRALMLRWLLGLPVPAPYTLRDLAADALGVLDGLGLGAAHVVGVSMGGMIAQTLAIEHPERLLSMTSIMSGPGDRWTSVGRPQGVSALFRRPARSREEAARRTVEIFRGIGSTGFDIDEERLAAVGALSFDRCPHGDGVARQMAAVLASGSRRVALRSVSVPSLVIHGGADPLLPPAAGRATAAAIPGARFIEIPGMGHDMPRGAWGIILDAIAEVASRSRTRAWPT